MNQTISTSIGIIMGLSLFVWTCHSVTKLFERNIKRTNSLWENEFQVHECGRYLAALANFHAVAVQKIRRDPKQSRLIHLTEDSIRSTILSRLQGEFEITPDHCFDLHSHAPLAELYLRNRDESGPDEPNYSYRVLKNPKL